MKIQIEITEEDAACLWANNWGPKDSKTLPDIVMDLLTTEVARFRRTFPDSVESAAEEFRKANAGDVGREETRPESDKAR